MSAVSDQTDRDTAQDIEDVPELLNVPDSDAGPSRQLERPKIPITLLTGYLGAGKSTLLEYILTADHGYRIAVCMNDFGDTTDIEARTLTLSDPTTQTSSTNFLSLPNGCLCCSVKDLGIAAIEEMVASQRGGVDWVVVELTGIADPAPIARSFWANEEMGDLILDGIICVVDSRNVLKQMSEAREHGEINEAQKQIACADVILINKTDLVDDSTLADVASAVTTLNPTLRIHKTVQSRLPLSQLFNLRAFSSERISLPTITETQSAPTPHSHHSGISTILIPLPSLSESQFLAFNEFVENLLWKGQLPNGKGGPEILRTKGYITRNDGREYVLQGVSDMFELKELEGSGFPEGSKDGKVVFIGRGVGEDLKKALTSHLGI